MDNSLLNNFQIKLITTRWEPSVDRSIERIETNIEWWSRYQDTIEHIQELFCIISFISVFFEYKVITGASIAISAALSRAITNSIKKQGELKNERKSVYKDIGMDKYLPNIHESASQKVQADTQI